jgi:hypothetical protein
MYPRQGPGHRHGMNLPGAHAVQQTTVVIRIARNDTGVMAHFTTSVGRTLDRGPTANTASRSVRRTGIGVRSAGLWTAFVMMSQWRNYTGRIEVLGGRS